MEEFYRELANCDAEEISTFIDQHILDSIPVVFNGDQSLHDNFRSRVADQFNVDKDNIVIVGSARTGFSYVNNTEFNDDSDVDVAIVNEALFDEYSQKLCKYHHDVIRYVVHLQGKEWDNYLAFLKYFAAGWLRPDKGTVVMNKTPEAQNWWKYFKSISHGKSEVGNHKVNGGIYKSDYYLNEYMKIGLRDRRSSIIRTGI